MSRPKVNAEARHSRGRMPGREQNRDLGERDRQFLGQPLPAQARHHYIKNGETNLRAFARDLNSLFPVAREEDSIAEGGKIKIQQPANRRIVVHDQNCCRFRGWRSRLVVALFFQLLHGHLVGNLRFYSGMWSLNSRISDEASSNSLTRFASEVCKSSTRTPTLRRARNSFLSNGFTR